MASISDIVEAAAHALARSEAACVALGVQARHPLGSGDWPLPGLPGVVPLWSDASASFGLMAEPGRAAETWPAVMVWREQAMTIATDAATLLPRFLVARYLSNLPDAADMLKQNWSALERSVHDLHAALGGKDSALEALADIVLDDRAHSRFRYSASTRAEFEAAHETLFRAIDPSPEFAAFAEWFATRLRGERTPPSPEAFGNWGRQALAWSLQFDIAAGDPGDDLARLAPLVTGHSGWDTSVSVAPGWYEPGSGGSMGFSAMAAQLIDTGAPLADPVDQRLVHAVSEAGTGYEGIAHAELVPVLDEQGQPERAWAALCAAAWWMQTSRSNTPLAILDGVQLLASHNGWADLAWIADHARGAIP